MFANMDAFDDGPDVLHNKMTKMGCERSATQLLEMARATADMLRD